MTFGNPVFSTKFGATEMVAQLKAACAWAELERGRATLYGDLITRYFSGNGDSQEHVLAYYESVEIVEIYGLWSERVEQFPGLKEKIREAIASGPLLQEDENPARSNNRPRNDAFGFAFAGRLVAAGCEVLAVEGVSRVDEPGKWVGDITVRHDGVVLDIQCKRPRTAAAIRPNFDKAKKQILEATCPGSGMIALDLSVIIRPSGTLLPAQSEACASAKLSNLIDTHLPGIADEIEMIGPEIVGIIVVGRIPSMITETSTIVGSNGRQYDITRPYSVAEIAVALNPLSPHASTLRCIGEKLDQWLKGRYRGLPQG